MISVKTKQILDALKNQKEDEFALVEEEKQIYQFKDGQWNKFNSENKGFTINLMELNSMLITQMPELESTEKGEKEILNYVNTTRVNYYMLLNNELRYYTVFHKNKKTNAPSIEKEVIECAKELGAIKSIGPNEDGVIEIWITEGDKSYPLYFFDYEKGVIECH